LVSAEDVNDPAAKFVSHPSVLLFDDGADFDLPQPVPSCLYNNSFDFSFVLIKREILDSAGEAAAV